MDARSPIAHSQQRIFSISSTSQEVIEHHTKSLLEGLLDISNLQIASWTQTNATELMKIKAVFYAVANNHIDWDTEYESGVYELLRASPIMQIFAHHLPLKDAFVESIAGKNFPTGNRDERCRYGQKATKTRRRSECAEFY